MTIDDMVSQVAKITGAAPKKTPETKPETKTDFTAAKRDEKEPPMLVSRLSIGLALAKEIAYCIERAADIIGVRAAVAVTDCDGQLILLEAMDRSCAAAAAAARDEAYAAAALGVSGADAQAAHGNEGSMQAGGVPLMHGNSVVGAIGVSGGTRGRNMTLAHTGSAYFGERIKSLKQNL